MAQEKQPAPSAAAADETAQNAALASQSKKAAPSSTATTVGGLAETHRKQLEARGITMETAKSMGLRSGQKGFIEFPFLKAGIEVNAKCRTFGERKEFYQIGGEQCFYNHDVIADCEDMLVITEGEMDCLTAIQCGYQAASVPNGAPKEAVGDRDSKKYDYLAAIPKTLKRIVLAVDGDANGANLLNDLAIRLGKHRCMWVKYPKGCKDLNETLMKYGERGVHAVIERAAFMDLDGIYRLSELPPLPEPKSENIGIIGLEISLRKSDFSVLTGIPSHGKSTFANNICYNLVQKAGWKIAFASFEQPPQTEHKRALTTLHSGRPWHLCDQQEREKADRWIDENFVFIVPPDNDDDYDLQWLKDRMAAAVTRYDVDMIVIDPWNEIDHMFDSQKMTMTQYVGAAIKDLKRFAKSYGVHVMVVAHPAKMRKESNGEYPIPTAYDISDSSHWYNKPEQVFVIHRKSDGTTLLRVAKSRYHYALGKPGDYSMQYDDYNSRYTAI